MHERAGMTGAESHTLNGFGAQIAALLAREEQRALDKIREDELRATLRKADEKRWDALDFRLDRVQASVENVSRDLAESLETRVSDAQTLRQQSDEVVARIDAQAEKVAAELDAQTQSVASDLARATLQTAAILKEREDGQVVKRFLSQTTRTIIAILAVVLFAGLAFALFEHRDDISGDIATGIAAMAAVVALVLTLTRRK
jgi:seryl-tRNA synthetase